MSVKGGVIAGILASIIATAVLWAIIMAGNIANKQAQAIAPGGSEADQKHVMSVKEMCVLLGTKKLKEDHSKLSLEINGIEISMEEISAKEGIFGNKAAPTTETVGGRELKIVYLGIRITDRTTQDSSRVIESKHIRALIRFLQMFAGCKVTTLSIDPQNVSQNKEELKRIRETLSANPWVGVPINVKWLWLYTLNKAKTMHLVLLQVVIQAVENTEAAGEEAMRIYTKIAVNHIQQILRLLGSLKCKKIKSIEIKINSNEQAAAEETKPAEVVQEWGYEVEKLQVSSNYHNVSAILPAWLVGKPTKGLKLDMCQYTFLSKEEVQSIRARKLLMYISDEIDLHSIESYAAQKKSKGVPNTEVRELCISYIGYFSEKRLTKEETLKHTRSSLAWAATQFPCLTEIDLSSLDSLSGNNSDLNQDISEMAFVFNPKMQNLKKVVIDGKEVDVAERVLVVEYQDSQSSAVARVSEPAQ